METLEKENDLLKKEVLKLKSSISKFSKGNEAFEKSLISQRLPSAKFGLDCTKDSSSSKSTMFVKSSTSHPSISLDANPKALCSKDKKAKVQRPKPKHHMIGKPKLNSSKAHASRVSKVNHKHAFMYTHTWAHKSHKHAFNSSCAHNMNVCMPSCKAPLKIVNTSKVQCHYCMRYGHNIFQCFVRRVHLKHNSMDNSMTNPQGPKYIWVPKNK